MLKLLKHLLSKRRKCDFQGCHRSCFQHELIRSCSCGDPRLPIPPNTTHCSAYNATARMNAYILCISRNFQYELLQVTVLKEKWMSWAISIIRIVYIACANSRAHMTSTVSRFPARSGRPHQSMYFYNLLCSMLATANG